MKAALKSTGIVLEMIKFQHTLFALPFALAGAILAAGGLPDVRTLIWIIAACVFARTAAMSFNRWVDASLDARNPRTATRAIPTGRLSSGFVLGFALLNAALFVWSAAMLNSLAFYLSPVALVVLLGYSYTKRFTWMAHFVLGLALGIAPIGAWIAVRGTLPIEPLLMGLAVLVWTAGFDLIYACQDIEVDSREGLYSIPSRFGAKLALQWSECLHIACIGALILLGSIAGLGWLYFIGVAAVSVLLFIEHRLVNPNDLTHIELAFFTVNSWVGVVILVFTYLDVLAGR